jgi:radical SAM protein with 4Fe4S-binding SPASM domain
MINPRIDCSQSPLAVRLKPHEIVSLDLEDSRRVVEYKKLASEFINLSEPRDELYHCGGGVNSFAIDPYGKMSICVLSQVDTYDLRRGSFREGWEQFLYKVRRGKKRTVLTKCVRCGLRDICGMCPANGELENGHPEEPVDFLCHVAHLRAQVFGIPIPPHGECEYCEGGSRYESLMQSVAALGDRPEATPDAVPLSLPVLSQQQTAIGLGCSSGGCMSCSLSALHRQ